MDLLVKLKITYFDKRYKVATIRFLKFDDKLRFIIHRSNNDRVCQQNFINKYGFCLKTAQYPEVELSQSIIYVPGCEKSRDTESLILPYQQYKNLVKALKEYLLPCLTHIEVFETNNLFIIKEV